MDVLRTLCLFSVLICLADGQCTFQTAFADSSWMDSTKGTLTFTSTQLTGWSFTLFTQTINTWNCYDSSNDTILMMRSTNSLTYSGLTFYAYLCLQLSQVSDNSYIYYQMNAEENNAGGERLKFSKSASLAVASVCSTTVTVPTFEFHFLVKSGFAEAVAQQCPDVLLFSADYSYTDSTGTVACTGLTDVWDMCTNTSQMAFNYEICSQTIVSSTGGQFLCMTYLTDSDITATVVYNQDTTLAAGASQFVCFVTDGLTASIAPSSCKGDQTASALPLLADGTTTTGALLTIVSKYTTCVPSSNTDSGLSAGAIAGIVIGVLLIIAIIAVVLAFFCVRRCQRNKVREEKTILVAEAEEATVTTVTETSHGAKRQRSNVAREKSNVSTKSKELTLSSPRATSTPTPQEKSSLSQKDKTPMASPREKNALSLKEKSPVTSPREKTALSLKSVSGKKGMRDMGTMVYEDELEPKGRFLGFLWTKLACCVAEKKEQKEETAEVAENAEPTAAKPEVPATGPVPSEGSPTMSKSTKMSTSGASGGKKGKGKTGASAGAGTSKGKSGLKSEKTSISVKADEKPTPTEESAVGLKKEKTSESIKNGKAGREKSTVSATGSPKLSRGKSTVSAAGSPKLGRQKSTVLTGLNGKTSPALPVRTGSSVSLRSSKSKGAGKDWTFLMCCFGNRKGELKDGEKTEAETSNGDVPDASKTPNVTNGKTKGKQTNGVTKVKPAASENPGATAGKSKKSAKKATTPEARTKDGKKAVKPEKSAETTVRSKSPGGKKAKQPAADQQDTPRTGGKEKSTLTDRKEKPEQKAKTEKPVKEKAPMPLKSGKQEIEKPDKASKPKDDGYKDKDEKDNDGKAKDAKGKDGKGKDGKGKASKEKGKPKKESKKSKDKSKPAEVKQEPVSPKSMDGKKTQMKTKEDRAEIKLSQAPVQTMLILPTSKSPKAAKRSKTMPLHREKTSSTLNTSKVKIEVHLPDDIESADTSPSARLTKTKRKTKMAATPKMKKSKTTLGDTVSAVEYYAPLNAPSPSPKKIRPLSQVNDFRIPPSIKTKS